MGDKSTTPPSSSRKFLGRRPLLSLPQIIVLLVVIAALIIGLDLTRRAQAGRQVGMGESALQAQVDLETTRRVELQATLTYVYSDDYVASYARDEGGLLLPGERRIVPLIIEVTSAPSTPVFEPTPDPAQSARSWQAWWQLLSDAPLPSP